MGGICDECGTTDNVGWFHPPGQTGWFLCQSCAEEKADEMDMEIVDRDGGDNDE